MNVSFAQLNLDSNIYKAIEACGYTQPTPIQAQSIPDILLGKDLVASAQTGTGKTAAFVLPALQRLSREPSKKTRVLILTPTRELANQIMKAASLYGKFLRFNIVSLVGGMPYHNQIKDLARGADIIVATPGRLMDHMEQKRVDLSGIEMMVLDEADRMLDMGFIDDVNYIAKLTPGNRQTLLFSATVDKQLSTVVKHLLKNPVRIDLSSEKIASPQIKQELYKANNAQHKMRLLKHFLVDGNIFKAIIFSATKIMADKLANQLKDEGFTAAALHGDLKQNVRNRTIEQLRRGKIQYLVATDVAARGIDISDITHVFNFDMPRFCEDYVHRIGRTGRAGKEGIAISFVMPTDLRHLQRIERYIGQRLKLINHVDIDEASFEKLAQKKEFHVANDRNSEEEFRNYSRPKKKFNDGKESNRDGYRFRKGDHSESRDSFRGRNADRNEGKDNFRGKSSSDRNESREGHRGKSHGDRTESREGFRGRSQDRSEGREGFRGRNSGRSEGRESFRGKSNSSREGFRFKKDADRKDGVSKKKIYTVNDREGTGEQKDQHARPKKSFGSSRRDDKPNRGGKSFQSFKKRTTKKTRWVSNDGQGVQVE